MLELLWLGVWLRALWRSIDVRERWAIAAAMCAGYLLVADTAAALATDVGDRNPFAFFNLALLGPGAGPMRAPGPLPLPALLLTYPLALRGLRCLVCGLACARYLRRSADLHPLLARTAVLESIAMPFAALATIDGVEAIVLGFGLAMTMNGW